MSATHVDVSTAIGCPTRRSVCVSRGGFPLFMPIKFSQYILQRKTGGAASALYQTCTFTCEAREELMLGPSWTSVVLTCTSVVAAEARIETRVEPAGEGLSPPK